MVKLICLVVAVALSLMGAGTAWADASADGNAGMDALNKGSYDQAIRLFSHALNSGELSAPDEEFAYFNRAQAYYDKKDFGHAIADLKAALRLKPDDADAESGLATAISADIDISDIGPPAQTAQTAQNPSAGSGGFWKSLGAAIVSGAVAGIAQGIQDAQTNGTQ